MAGLRKKKPNLIRRIKTLVHNWRCRRRIAKQAKREGWHDGTKQILRAGVWEDKDHNLYNCMGQKIGKIEWSPEWKKGRIERK